MSAAALPELPRRDDEARTRLHAAAARATTAVLARDRLLVVGGEVGALLPAGGVRRGSTIALDGPPGTGATTVACALAAAATSAGEWAAIVDPEGTFGGRAAHAAGVALERCAVVRKLPTDRWTTVVAALLDGVTLVVAAAPARLGTGDARRLTARARERASVLVALGSWPAEATMRLHTRSARWRGLGMGRGLLAGRVLDVHVEAKGVKREPDRVRLVS